jgi:hypothetical protein
MKTQTVLFVAVLLFFTSCNKQQNNEVQKDALAKEETIKTSVNTFVETF